MASNFSLLDSYCQPVSSFWAGLDEPNRGYDEIDFTLCFQDTVFLSATSLIFILSALVHFLYFSQTKFHIKFNWLNVSKCVLISFLIAISTAESMYTIVSTKYESLAPFQISSPTIALISFVFALILIYYHRYRGIYSSGIFHIFWLALLIFDIIKIRTYSLDIEGGFQRNIFSAQDNSFYLSIACLNLCTHFILCVLTLLPDKIPESWFKGIEKPSPEERATFLSQITWWWLNGLIWRGYRRALDRTDLWSLPRTEMIVNSAAPFRTNWMSALKKKQQKFARQYNLSGDEDVLLRSMRNLEKEPLIQSSSPYPTTSAPRDRSALHVNCLWVLIRSFWLPFLKSAFLRLFCDTMVFISPLILKLIINFVQNPDEPYWHGLVFAAVIFSSSVIRSLFYHQHFDIVFRLGMNIRAALISIVYRKSLKLSAEGRQKSTTGEMVNLMSIDSQRFMDLVTFLNYLWSAPYQAVLAIIFLYFTIQYAVFAGLIVMLLLIPINSVLAAVNRKIQARQMALKDKRIKAVTEMLNGIKVIKLYSWESPHQSEILSLRDQEMRMLKYSAIMAAISGFFWQSAPVLVSLASFATYVLAGNALTADVAFVALSLFGLLKVPLATIPWTISMVVESSVSVTRLNKFLNLEELDPHSVDWSQSRIIGGSAISLRNASFSWQLSGGPILKKINLEIPTGALISVIGQVGCGKSSLLMALLGEMEKLSGDAKMSGTVAYVPQIAWMQNASLKDNILFGALEQPDRYQDVLRACALETDIQILPTGDQTEIGEKGINLSGGQKQRVSLARAVYQDCDVYFLDDTLSAVDAHVGQHIYEEVIGPNGLLKNKTRIFVTHNLNYVSDSDYIIMLENGSIAEQGEYETVIGANGHIAHLIDTFVTVREHEEAGSDPKKHAVEKDAKEGSKTKSDKGAEKEGGIISEETVESGHVQLKVLFAYLKSIGIILSIFILASYILSFVANGGASFWLVYWTNQYAVNNASSNSSNTSSLNVDFYLGVYAGLGLVQGLFTFVSTYLLALGAISASRYLHKIMLLNIFRCPLAFFDTTPTGRIINRFSKDIYLIDENIPRSISTFISTAFGIVLVFIIISSATPIFLVVILPLLIFYFVVQRIYVATSRQLKRIESVSRSPIFSHFQETLNGTSTIRAYKRTSAFILRNELHVDFNNEANFPSLCANRWLGLRLELVGHFVVLFASLFAVVSRQMNVADASLIGLSISYSLEVTGLLNWMVRMSSELETNIVSVERVKEYAELKTEASAVTENINLPANWPQQGVVQFNQYSVRYRPDLDVVIDKLDLEVKGSQKLAVVGRTGAGKSSLTLALFRILEAAEGNIMIDGVNIADVGLSDLRSRLTIIPQDPVLFSGTIRSNLDPFSKFILPIFIILNQVSIKYSSFKLKNKLKNITRGSR